MRDPARWRRRSRPGVNGIARRNHHDRRRLHLPACAGFFYLGIALGAQAVQVHLALCGFDAQVLFIGAVGAAEHHVKVAT
jgi:hypothetical protein